MFMIIYYEYLEARSIIRLGQMRRNQSTSYLFLCIFGGPGELILYFKGIIRSHMLAELSWYLFYIHCPPDLTS